MPEETIMSFGKIHVIGGGTFNDVRNHLSIAARSFGHTARYLYSILADARGEEDVRLHLTKMADPANGTIVTNTDMALLLNRLVMDSDTRAIILTAAICDYKGSIVGSDIESGSHAPRLKTADGERLMRITPADKLIGRLRQHRKDIFVVGCKVTTGATADDQYATALPFLKKNSLNLVLANDTVTRHNFIVAPEESRYYETKDRPTVLRGLAQMILDRTKNTFTRSTVVEGEPVAWNSGLVPENLREVVNHVIARGGYKPVLGVTAGHFAARVDDRTVLTSIRKRNLNDLADIGLVRIEYDGLDKVIAYGAKPSVGGQSQRIIFDEHPDVDCIVHAHVPLRQGASNAIPLVDQRPNECGSHQCGQATSRGLTEVEDGIKVVMLDGHGPNVVFSRTTPARKVIDFIERNFDLEAKTGGMVSA